MPIKQNAVKALRQANKHMQRNKLVNAELKSMRVKLRKLVTDKKAKEAAEVVRALGQKLDKAVAKGILKQNTVARTKSRLMKSVNALTKKA
jgi:small subunit ribosomal protein S20